MLETVYVCCAREEGVGRPGVGDRRPRVGEGRPEWNDVLPGVGEGRPEPVDGRDVGEELEALLGSSSYAGY